MTSINSQQLILSAPISRVTVLEDRAQIRRQSSCALTPGQWRLKVEAVSPLLSNKTLRAQISPSGSRLIDVKVQRQKYLQTSDPSSRIQPLLEELTTLQDEFAQIAEDRQQGDTLELDTQMILSQFLQELPIDAVWGQLDTRMWREHLHHLFEQIRRARLGSVEGYLKQQDLRDQIIKVIDQIRLTLRPDDIISATLEANVMISREGEYSVQFDYVVPNALWRPYHQARLQQGESPVVNWQMDGCVWQWTGEDWDTVDLVLSTERPSLGTDPPLLLDDPLRAQKRSKQLSVEMRDQKIQDMGPQQRPMSPPSSSVGTVSEQASENQQVSLSAVDDGGEVRIFQAPYKATILSDGHPYRVLLYQMEMAAEVESICYPEVSASVVIKSVHTNPAPFPILPGPVDLIRSTEFTGRTTVSYCNTGETFSLGWGPETAIRVQRQSEQKQRLNEVTQWTEVETQIGLYLSNIGPRTQEILLKERVPVSEIEQVKVEVDYTNSSDGLSVDHNGFCHWRIRIDPYSYHHYALVYRMAYSPDIVMLSKLG